MSIDLQGDSVKTQIRYDSKRLLAGKLATEEGSFFGFPSWLFFYMDSSACLLRRDAWQYGRCTDRTRIHLYRWLLTRSGLCRSVFT